MKVGTVVELKTPYHPSLPGRELRQAVNGSSTPTYHSWQGFTHGVVMVQVDAFVVGLFLYDPAKAVCYCDGRGYPVHADFTEDEIIPIAVSIAGSGAYESLKGEVSSGK